MIPRNKSKNSDEYTTEGYWNKPAGGSWGLVVERTMLSRVNRSTAKGYDIPGFHKLKREGALLPATPWEQFSVTGTYEGACNFTDQTGATSETRPGNVWDILPTNGWIVTTDDILAKADSQVQAELVQAAAARIYSSGWDALTFASEFHKTLSMFTTAKKRLVRILKDPAFRRQYFDLLLRDKKQAKQWLEYRYGWRTLMYDIKDLRKALNNLGNKRTRFSERVGTSISGSTDNFVSHEVTGSQTGEGYDSSESWTISVRGTVTADIEPPTFQFNPVVTGWELITFSFVIDWFLSVGQALEAMSFLMLATNYTAAAGIQGEFNRTWEYVPGTLVNPPWAVSNVSGRSTSTGILTARSPTSVSKTPKVRMNLDVSKLIDLASLARVRL